MGRAWTACSLFVVAWRVVTWRVVTLALALASFVACGSSSNAPMRQEVASGNEGTARSLRGSYAVAEMGGGPLLPSLLDDPACYAGRALVTFHDDDTVSFALETACEGDDGLETVCSAELTTQVEWQADGFRVPVAVRARGHVTRFLHGEGVASAEAHDACQVGLTPMRWRIVDERARLVLENEHGDRMVLDRDAEGEARDWSAITRRARERRLAGRGPHTL